MCLVEFVIFIPLSSLLTTAVPFRQLISWATQSTRRPGQLRIVTIGIAIVSPEVERSYNETKMSTD